MIASEMFPRWPVLGSRNGLTARAAGGPRRALFRTRDDVAESLNFVRHEIAVLTNESTARWNFDFTTGQPLSNGRYQWTAVGQAESAGTGTQTTNLSEPSTTTPENTSLSLKQTKMPDYWCSRKRHSSSPSTKSSSPQPPAKVQKRTAST